MDGLATPIELLPGTAPQTIKRFKSIGLHTVADMIRYVPFRYEDFSKIAAIADLQEGENVTIRGHVASVSRVPTRSRVTIQKAVLQDNSGKIEVTWFNQPYILNILRPGLEISIAGAAKRFGAKFSFEPKEYEVVHPDKPLQHTARLVPVYPTKYGVSTKLIRDKIGLAFDRFVEPGAMRDWEFLPEAIRSRHNLIPEGEAYGILHRPESLDQVNIARRRLGFDELFTIQLSSLIVRKQWEEDQVGIPLDTQSPEKKIAIEGFVSSLPFALTSAQLKVTDDILHDMGRRQPMNRFVQGDVGSGKTVVAAIAAYTTWMNGFQSLVMAPTEILAQQHYLTLQKLFQPHGLEVGLFTRSYKSVPSLVDPAVVVGTHALLSEKLQLNKIGLVVIDEQHRFGVAQRALLKDKGMNPHLLTMTATPIPRTVALTLYGELDLSVIDEMPKGRLPIKTAIVPEQKRDKAYGWIREQIKTEGTQVFIICPLIDESDAETMQTVKAANVEYERLKKHIFPDCNVALIHGKMKAKEKDDVMREFKDRKYDILVSTSVVEVGIDVPNATIMIIEGAERYGLAQLHQLRGRVGRGDKQSYCFLFTSAGANQFSQRLQFFSKTNSGMKLAEYDLEQRGAGEIYGTRQSGMEDLQFASLSDLPVIEETKKAAEAFLQRYTLEDYPGLKKRLDDLRALHIAKD